MVTRSPGPRLTQVCLFKEGQARADEKMGGHAGEKMGILFFRLRARPFFPAREPALPKTFLN
jgi:hypothetical protein